MSVPTDLVDPTTLRDPVEEFFRQGGIDVPEDENSSMNQARKVALIGTALAAAFIVYRTLIHKELDQVEPPATKDAAMRLISMAWGRSAAPWQRAALPAAVRAYQLGQTSQMTDAELETLASHYVASLGEYMHSTSAQAMADGFQAQLNKGWSKDVAWVRSVYGYGLDDTQTRQYLKSFAEGAKAGYIADPIPSASRKVVDVALSTRAKRFGDTEAWSAVQTGKNVVWLYKITTGELPVGMKKRWITAHDERVCPVCGPLDNKTILVERRFHTSDGKKIYAPGIHPNCRCTMELVYPQNRVDELVRKNRPGDPYDRDQDGHFARRETRGWTYQQAMDDHEKKRPTLTRVRERVLEPEAPTTTRTSNPFEEPKANPFGVVSNPFGATKANPFTSANPFAPAAPVKAAAPAVRRQVIVVVTPEGTEKEVVVPETPADDKGYPDDGIGQTYFAHNLLVEGHAKIRQNRTIRGQSEWVVSEPEIGDVISMEDGLDVQRDPGMSAVQASIDEEYRTGDVNAGDERDARERFANLLYGASYEDLSPAEAESVDAELYDHTNTTIPIIYSIQDSKGFVRQDDTLKRVYGKYVVVDIEDVDAKDIIDGGGNNAVRLVHLEYIDPGSTTTGD